MSRPSPLRRPLSLAPGATRRLGLALSMAFLLSVALTSGAAWWLASPDGGPGVAEAQNSGRVAIDGGKSRPQHGMVNRAVKKGATTIAGPREHVVWPFGSTTSPNCSTSGSAPGTAGCCSGLADCGGICLGCTGGQVCDATNQQCACSATTYWDGSSCRTCKTCETLTSGTCVLKTDWSLDSSGNCEKCDSPRSVVGTDCVCTGGKIYNPTAKTCDCPPGQYADTNGDCTVCASPRQVVGGQCVCGSGLTWCAGTSVCVTPCQGQLALDTSTCKCGCTAPKVANGGLCECPTANGGYQKPDGTCDTCASPRTVQNNVCGCYGLNQSWDSTSLACVCSTGFTLCGGACVDTTCPTGQKWDATQCKCVGCGPCEQLVGTTCTSTCSGATPICDPDQGTNGTCVGQDKCCSAQTKGFCESTACAGTWTPNAAKTCVGISRFSGGSCANCQPTDPDWRCTTDSTGQCRYMDRCNSSTCVATWKTCSAGGQCSGVTNCSTSCKDCQTLVNGQCTPNPPCPAGESCVNGQCVCDSTGQPKDPNQTACCSAGEAWVGGKCTKLCGCCETWDATAKVCKRKAGTQGHICATKSDGTQECKADVCGDRQDPRRDCPAGTAYWGGVNGGSAVSDIGLPTDDPLKQQRFSWACSASYNKGSPGDVVSNLASTKPGLFSGSLTLTCGDECGKWEGSGPTCGSSCAAGQVPDTCPGAAPNACRPACRDCETYDCTQRRCVGCDADEECATTPPPAQCVCKVGKKPKEAGQTLCCQKNFEWNPLLLKCAPEDPQCDDSSCTVQCIYPTTGAKWTAYPPTCPVSPSPTNSFDISGATFACMPSGYTGRGADLTAYKAGKKDCCTGKCCTAPKVLVAKSSSQWACECPEGTMDDGSGGCEKACSSEPVYWDANGVVPDGADHITFRGGRPHSDVVCGATFPATAAGASAKQDNEVYSSSTGALVDGEATRACGADGQWGALSQESCSAAASQECSLVAGQGGYGRNLQWFVPPDDPHNLNYVGGSDEYRVWCVLPDWEWGDRYWGSRDQGACSGQFWKKGNLRGCGWNKRFTVEGSRTFVGLSDPCPAGMRVRGSGHKRVDWLRCRCEYGSERPRNSGNCGTN